MSTRGEIVSFDGNKGYGWIRAEDGPDVFVHVNDLDADKRDVRGGVLVEFDEEDGPKGPRATNVRVVGGAGGSGSRQPVREEREPREPRDGDDLEVDILTPTELRRELTERLLAVDPPLLSTQVLAVRGAVDSIARRYGWVAD